MSTKIEWVARPGTKPESWNMIGGCSPVSAGCANCYAARVAAVRLRHHPRYAGTAEMRDGKACWTGRINLDYEALKKPLSWKKPRTVFVCSMSDLFHEDVPFEFVDSVFLTMTACTGLHTFQVLTKRPERMLEYFTTRQYYSSPQYHAHALPGVWLGVSVENQDTADARHEYLRRCPAAVRFVSYEPALGPVDWTGWEFVSQIISGGESGPGARPSHPDWHRATRDFCQANGTAYFFKQWGAWQPVDQSDERVPGNTREHVFPDGTISLRIGKKAAGHPLDGREWREWPN